MKLISMLDFVLKQQAKKIPSNEKPYDFYIEVTKYANFLKQLLNVKTIFLFKGFEKKKEYDGLIEISNGNITLFFDPETPEVSYSTKDYDGYLSTIEDLIPFNLELSKNSIKQFEL
jgi:hypothetical protein